MTADALADLARVARLAAVNVVDAKPLRDAAAIAAGLASAFPHVLALGAAPVLAKRRGGNIVLAGAHDLPALDRLRARAAADSSPATLLTQRVRVSVARDPDQTGDHAATDRLEPMDSAHRTLEGGRRQAVTTARSAERDRCSSGSVTLSARSSLTSEL